MKEEKEKIITELSGLDRRAALGFSYFKKIGSKRWRLLTDNFPDLTTAFNASAPELMKAGLKKSLTEEFINWRKSFLAERELKQLAEEKISFTTWHDNDYPPAFKTITDAPPLIYYRGEIKLLNRGVNDCLAVVGSRQHSAYGAQTIKMLIPDIAKIEIKIISGLALGIDTLAHQAALKNGITVAVLGSGLAKNCIYPAQNRRLAEEILNKGGILISEFPPDTPPLRQNFPRRNRLISGLAKVTLVIEASEKSGALTTAHYAKLQNRELLVIPGAISSKFSRGTNQLIKDGGRIVSSTQDIINFFSSNSAQTFSRTSLAKKVPSLQQFTTLNKEEEIVYCLIKQASEQGQTVSTDKIARDSQLDTATINSKLSILELAGRIRLKGAGYELNIII